MCLYPASEPVWGYSNQLSGFRMLTLLFDTDDLRRRLPDELAPLATLEPRLRFAEDGIWHLAQLLAEECSSAQRYGALYAESLIVALFSRLVRAAAAPEAVRRGGLSKRQLALALDFIEGHLHQAIGLGELAQLTGLSQSHFCHAFKVSTGLAPHRWQLAARVRRAELLLLERPLSVRDVARALGFADQSHFTRVFRQHTGATPAAWRRDRLH
jgi:AraC-like DNA-binding protein